MEVFAGIGAEMTGKPSRAAIAVLVRHVLTRNKDILVEKDSIYLQERSVYSRWRRATGKLNGGKRAPAGRQSELA